MPGTPVLQQLEARIAEMGGEDAVIFDRIADGERLVDIMADLAVARTTFYKWLSHRDEDARRAKYASAKVSSASALAEDGGRILDELAAQPASQVTPALVALSGKRADWRRWQASMRDPAEYGDRGAGIVFNVGSLHLDALRAVGSIPKPALQPIEDALLITDGEGED